MNLSMLSARRRAGIYPRDMTFYPFSCQFPSQTDNSWCFIGGNLKCFQTLSKCIPCQIPLGMPAPHGKNTGRCSFLTIKKTRGVSKYKGNPNLACRWALLEGWCM